MENVVENLVKKLTERLEIERIFKVDVEVFGVTYVHLLLVIPQQMGLSNKVMQPVVELCMMGTTQVTYEILIFGEWKSKLKQGSLYYNFLSLPQHQVFSSSNNLVKTLSKQEIGGVMALFEEMKTQYDLKAEELLNASTQMEETGNLLKAAYMFHQFIKQHLATLQFFVLAKVNKCSALNTKFKSVMTHMPMWMSYVHDHHHQLFRVLDTANAAVSKNQLIALEHSEFQEAKRLWMRLLGEMELFYQRIDRDMQVWISTHSEQKDSEVKREGVPSIGKSKSTYVRLERFEAYPGSQENKAALNQLIDRIQEDYGPEELILLSYRSSGFTRQFFKNHSMQAGCNEEGVQLCLVGIKRKCGPIKHRALKNKGAEALVLFFDREKVQHALKSGNDSVSWFHAMIGQNAQLILKKETVLQPTYCESKLEKLPPLLTNQKVYDTVINQLYDLEYLLTELLVQEKSTQAFLLGNMLELGLKCVLKARLGYVPLDLSLHQLILFSLIADPRIYEFIWGGHRIDPVTLRAALNYKNYLNAQSVLDLGQHNEFQIGNFASEWRGFVKRLLNECAVIEEEGLK